MFKRVSFLALMLLALLYQAPAAMAAWPKVAPPPDANMKSVGQDMRLNGVDMRVTAFTSDMSADAVLAFYRQRWQHKVENTLGEWQIIGRQEGGYYITVQVKPGEKHATEGLIGISELPALRTAPKVDASFPRMQGTQMISDMNSNDSGKKGKTLVMHNGYSVHSNASFYQTALPREGWRQNTAYGGLQTGGDAHAMFFVRGTKSCNIVINRHPEGGSAVVVNIVTNYAK